MTNEQQYTGTLYNFSSSVFCGVYLTEEVMKKIAKAQNKYLEEVKRILTDNVEDIYVSDWTLHYPGGKQTVVNFTNPNSSKEQKLDRIRFATIRGKPEPVFPVFYANSMEEAEKLADKRYEAL